MRLGVLSEESEIGHSRALVYTVGHDAGMDAGHPRRVFHGPRDYLELARSVEATPDELRELAGWPYPFVRQAVAENPTSPTEALRATLPVDPHGWNDFVLLATLARHPATDERLLRDIGRRIQLAGLHHDRNPERVFEAGIALFQQPKTPDDLLFAVLDDEASTTQFRKVAARETTHVAVIERLLNDRSETVRMAAERRRCRSA